VDRRLRRGERMLSIDNLRRSLRGKVVGMVGMGSTARRAAEIFHVSHVSRKNLMRLACVRL
jgi:D-3-phosphoglycerate dehydrogenase